MTIGQAVSIRIQELCTERDITINKCATICGITQSTLNNIVSGIIKSPKIDTIKKICDGLEISIVDFFQDDLFRNLEQELK